MTKEKEQDTLTRIPNTSANYVITALKIPKTYVQRDGQLALILATTGYTEIYIYSDEAGKPQGGDGMTLYEAFSTTRMRELPLMYYMILDKIAETKYNQTVLEFTNAEIADLLGISKTNAAKTTGKFVDAALALKGFNFTIALKGMKRHLSLVRYVDEYDNARGFAVTVEEQTLPILQKEIAKIGHDKALYRVKPRLFYAFHMGKKIEEIADRTNEQTTIEVLFGTLVRAINEPPLYITGDERGQCRNYSRRLELFEKGMAELVRVGFLSHWEWIPITDENGNKQLHPCSIADESKFKVHCEMKTPHIKTKKRKDQKAIS